MMLYTDAWLSDVNFWGVKATGFMDGDYTEVGTKTIAREGIPTGDDWIWADIDVDSYNASGSWENNYSGGINLEVGSEFHTWVEEDGTTTREFAFWHYNTGVEGMDWNQGDYDVIVIQDFADGSNIWFRDFIGIYNLSGATKLATATITAATAFYGLI